MHSSSSVLSMAHSLPTTVVPIVKKEVPTSKKGAKGKLLVPDVSEPTSPTGLLNRC